MKFLYPTVLSALLLLSGQLCAQKEGHIWYFGSAGIDFNGGGPQALLNSAMSQFESVSTVSDSAGNLLFYTDGISVWDSTHSPMPNGFGLLGDTSSSQVLVVPQPGNDSLYYIFTRGPASGPRAAHYSIVDMSANGNRGDVISKNISMFDPGCEGVCAVKHANGVDIWIISHEWLSDGFRAFKLTCNGLEPGVTSNVGTFLMGNPAKCAGYLQASHSGLKVANTISGQNLVEVFDFDAATGVLSPNPLQLSFSKPPYGCEFSPNDSKLYVSCQNGFGNHLWQFDLAAGNPSSILNSRYAVDSFPSYPYFGALQLAPDGSIYMSRVSYVNGYIDRIEMPDQPGPACSFVDSALFLNGGTPLFGLPHDFEFIGRPHLDTARWAANVVCLGDTTWFQDASDYLPDSAHWDFGDPPSGTANFSSDLEPQHIFSGAGTFQVTRITYRSCISDTVSHWVTVTAPPLLDLGADTSICGAINLQLNGPAGGSYLWSTGDTLQNITVNATGTYWLEVGNGNCLARDSIVIGNSPPPTVDLGPDTSICMASSLQLSGPAGGPYLWSTGDTLQSITVNAAGTYWLEVGIGNCSARDSIELVLSPALSVDLGPDSTFNCGPISMALDAGHPGASHVWSTGDTGQTLVVTQADTFWVEVNENGCVGGDTLIVDLAAMPPLELGGPDTLCLGDSLILDSGLGWDQVLWSTGATTNAIAVNVAGSYSVTVEFNACSQSDTIEITTRPSLSVNLPDGDQALCVGAEATLDAGPGGDSYLWSTGDTGRTMELDSPGLYFVLVENACESQLDSAVFLSLEPPMPDLGEDLELCKGEAPVLTFSPSPSGFLHTFLWSTGDTLPSTTIEDAGTYWLSVSNACGTGRDSLRVALWSESDLFIPNVVTPNGDGVADFFIVEVKNPESFSLQVMDRWGREVFATRNPYPGWDGTFLNAPASEGTYFFKLMTRNCRGELVEMAGSFSLIR